MKAKVRIALFAVALVVTLAACSGSAGNTGDKNIGNLNTSAVCGLGNGKAATGAPIKIGAMATASGGIDFSSAVRSAAAFFKCVNANGGINGRPIGYALGDDALDPPTTAPNADQ